VKTDKQTITIYKAHGIYATERDKVIKENIGAWKTLANELFGNPR